MAVYLLWGEKNLWMFFFHQTLPVNIKHQCHCQMLPLASQHDVPSSFLLCLTQIAVSWNAVRCLLTAEIIHWLVKKMLILATE